MIFEDGCLRTRETVTFWLVLCSLDTDSLTMIVRSFVNAALSYECSYESPTLP
jgi:hypothetical protein